MTNDRYDFFVLQSSTAGGHALNQFLRAHPRIHLPDREVVDGLFEQGRPEMLCSHSVNPLLIPPWPNDYRLGFLLHARVQLEARVPQQVKALCRAGATLFQLVRNPIDVVVASHKRYIQITIFREVAQKLGLKGHESDVPLRTPEQVYEWLKPRLLYYEQGQRFAPDFARLELIDATDLRASRVEATMRHLYGLLDVDPEFRCELFHKDFHGFLQRMFEFHSTELNLLGCKLPVRFELSSNVGFVRDDFTHVLATTRCKLGSVGEEEKELEVALLTRPPLWAALPEKLRAHLKESGQLQHLFEKELLPAWRKLADSMRKFIEDHRVRELPQPLLQKMRAELDADYRQLFRLRPDLQERWGW